jgi:hypothetical protein
VLNEDTVIPRGVGFGFEVEVEVESAEMVVMMATGCGTRRIKRRTSRDSDGSGGWEEVFGELFKRLFLVEKRRFD